MSRIDLHPVTSANWRACAALSVRTDQARFVAPVTYYLCLCAYGDTWQPMAVVRDGMVVGFCMYGIDDDGSAWIGGLIIDQSQQRTGAARRGQRPDRPLRRLARVSWDGPQLCARQRSCTDFLPLAWVHRDRRSRWRRGGRPSAFCASWTLTSPGLAGWVTDERFGL